MAETFQIARWALGHHCRLRPSGEDVSSENISVTLKQISRAQAYRENLQPRDGFGIYHDVWVSSFTTIERPGARGLGGEAKVPVDGFLVSQEFAPFGGIGEIQEMCANCPANPAPTNIAGCAGIILQHPGSRGLDEQLQSILIRLGLRELYGEHFPKTRPLWFGLWAQSPVPAKSLPLLALLLSEKLQEDRANHCSADALEDLSRLLAAVQLAGQRNIPLHLELLPPGHADFGFATVYPHCPFCKAASISGRWISDDDLTEEDCEVCGTRFSPARTARRTPMLPEPPTLREEMGATAYRNFARQYLLANGENPKIAEEILEKLEQTHRENEERTRRRIEREQLLRDYLKNHIYCGLPRVAPPRSSNSDTGSHDETTDSVQWFDAGNFAEVLRRIEVFGLTVNDMTHRSEDGTMDRHLNIARFPGYAGKTFEVWQGAGCKGKFAVTCLPP